MDQIWAQETKEEAEKQLQYWRKRAQESKLPAMMEVANMLLAKRTGILAWYDCKVTNAILEDTNNKVKVLQRKAYCYRDDEYVKLLLLGMKDETVKTDQSLSDQREKRKNHIITIIQAISCTLTKKTIHTIQGQIFPNVCEACASPCYCRICALV